jgi:biopolymer transport protein ExbB
VGYLSLIAAVSPMLGLFGTVQGMIITFNVIANSEVQPKPAQLAGGISTALVTTFEGLVVAIPMTALYAVFRNRVVNVIMEIGGITEELTSRFKTPSSS